MLTAPYYQLRAAQDDYFTAAEGVRKAAPGLLGDPLILAAVLQVELGELALKSLLKKLLDESDE